MKASFLHPVRALLFMSLASLLAACQSVPPPTGFSPAQIAVLQSQGFVESAPDWVLTLPDRLLFATDESNLKPEQIDAIAQIARRLASVDITTARVEGHTDSTGTAAYNLRLSQARAEAVAAAMQANGMRLPPDQIVGRGETLPLSSNDTAEGRQDNRRVAIIVWPQ